MPNYNNKLDLSDLMSVLDNFDEEPDLPDLMSVLEDGDDPEKVIKDVQNSKKDVYPAFCECIKKWFECYLNCTTRSSGNLLDQEHIEDDVLHLLESPML